MRHTFAVNHILEGGEDVAKWLQQQMGPSSIAVTLDTYADWFKKSDAAQANRAASRLLGDAAGDGAS